MNTLLIWTLSMAPLVSVSIGLDCNTFLLFYFPNPLAKYEFYHYRNWSIQSKSACFGWLHKAQFQFHIKPAQIITIFSLHFLTTFSEPISNSLTDNRTQHCFEMWQLFNWDFMEKRTADCSFLFKACCGWWFEVARS